MINIYVPFLFSKETFSNENIRGTFMIININTQSDRDNMPASTSHSVIYIKTEYNNG